MKMMQKFKINLNYESALQMIAACYWQQNEWSKAYESYDKVLKINPDNKDAVKFKNDSYEKMKNK